jgi:hypothetical protein
VDVQELIAFQRAEFDAAEKWRIRMGAAEFLLLLLAIASVFIDGTEQVACMALFSFVVGLVWLWFDYKYGDTREVAERARRATLIMRGFDQVISPTELADIKGRFTASMAEAAKKIDPAYYRSTSEPGSQRLAEMLEESSFFSMRLQRLSAEATYVLFALSLAASLVVFGIAVIALEKDAIINSFRIFLIITTFLVTGRIFKLGLRYSNSARTLDRIHGRLAEARIRSYPRPDLLLVLSDYNAAIEAASLHLPFIYDFHQKRLNDEWGDYCKSQPEPIAKAPRIRGL